MGCALRREQCPGVDGADIYADVMLQTTILANQYTGALLLMKDYTMEKTYDIAKDAWTTNRKPGEFPRACILLKMKCGKCLFMGIPENDTFLWKFHDSFRKSYPGFTLIGSIARYFDGKLIIDYLKQQSIRVYSPGAAYGYDAFAQEMYNHISSEGESPSKPRLLGGKPRDINPSPMVTARISANPKVVDMKNMENMENRVDNPFCVD